MHAVHRSLGSACSRAPTLWMCGEMLGTVKRPVTSPVDVFSTIHSPYSYV